MKAQNPRVAAEARRIDTTTEPDFPPHLGLSIREGSGGVRPERPRNRAPDRLHAADERHVSGLLRGIRGRELLDLLLEHVQLAVGNEERGLRELWLQLRDGNQLDVRTL